MICVDHNGRGVIRSFEWLDEIAARERHPGAPGANGVPSAASKAFVTDRLGHDRRYAIVDGKLREELGCPPGRGSSSGFAETLDWCRTNESWWHAVLGEWREV